MPIVEQTADEKQQEMSFEREQKHWLSIENERQREFELKKAKEQLHNELEFKKLEAKVASLNIKSRERYIMAQRIVIGLVKLPVLPLALLAILIINLSNGELPETLENFIDL